MKNYSLKPTDENALILLRDNPIGRNSNVFGFINLLGHIHESCTIAINGEWGSGKTFFVRQVKMILDALNENTMMPAETRSAVKECCRQMNDSEMDCHSTVYYNAWMYDNADDPILSLVYATIASNQTDFTEEKKCSVLGTASALVDALTGRDISTLLKEARGKDTFERFKDADDIQAMVKRFINALIEEHGNRLVFFIDELDRCKPDYAIRFMERIKHYFDDDRVTFVFSVSLSQLQATVKNYYGTEFNATRYLDKFFDLRVSLASPNVERFMNSRLRLYDNTIIEAVCIETAKQYGLSLRELERFVRLVKICARPEAMRVANGFRVDNARFFSVSYVIPIMLALQMTDMPLYSEFVAGKKPQPLLDILHWPNIYFDYGFLLAPDEEYDTGKTAIKTKTGEMIELSQRMLEAYNAIFTKSPNRNRAVTVGSMEISVRTRDYIEEVISLLSQLSDYDYE